MIIKEDSDLRFGRERRVPVSGQVVAVVGQVGRWQMEKAAMVVLISIPGLAHIFLTPFLMPATDFWCRDLVRGSQAFNDSKVGTAACSPILT